MKWYRRCPRRLAIGRRPGHGGRMAWRHTTDCACSKGRQPWLLPRDGGARFRLHPDRAAGGDRDHRGPDRAVAPGGAGRPRGRPPRPMRQQPQADRDRPARATTTPTASCRSAGRGTRAGTPCCSYFARCHSMFTAILPYVEQATVFNAVNFSFGAVGDRTPLRRHARPGPGDRTPGPDHHVHLPLGNLGDDLSEQDNWTESDLPDVLRGGHRLLGHLPLVVRMSSMVLSRPTGSSAWTTVPGSATSSMARATRCSWARRAGSGTRSIPGITRGRSRPGAPSSIPGVTRLMAFATTAPRLNANLQIPDPNPSYSLHRLGR